MVKFHYRTKQDQAIHLDTYTPSNVKSKKVTTSLYPYQSIKLKVIFVYGTDFNFGIQIFNFLQIKQHLFKGSIPTVFNLRNNENENIPNRMIQRINKAMVSMIENGFYTFYKSFAKFLDESICEKFNQMHDDDAVALTVEQLKIPLIIYFILLGLASVFLTMEIIIHRIKIWRIKRVANQSVVNQQRGV